jgi:hypothetical protein
LSEQARGWSSLWRRSSAQTPPDSDDRSAAIAIVWSVSITPPLQEQCSHHLDAHRDVARSGYRI